jgi:hypothetical protein
MKARISPTRGRLRVIVQNTIALSGMFERRQDVNNYISRNLSKIQHRRRSALTTEQVRRDWRDAEDVVR